MSEAGAIPRPKPQQRAARRETQINPSTNLHTESRPSMLSADRIALTQHSGALLLFERPVLYIQSKAGNAGREVPHPTNLPYPDSESLAQNTAVPSPVVIPKVNKCHGEIYDTKGRSGHVCRLQASSAVAQAHVQTRMRLISMCLNYVIVPAGILNLMMLILVAANARLIVENLLKYGVLTSPANWLKWLVPSGNFPLLLCWPALALSVLIANGIERLGFARLKAEKKVRNSCC